jgi:hypothetical protein
MAKDAKDRTASAMGTAKDKVIAHRYQVANRAGVYMMLFAGWIVDIGCAYYCGLYFKRTQDSVVHCSDVFELCINAGFACFYGIWVYVWAGAHMVACAHMQASGAAQSTEGGAGNVCDAAADWLNEAGDAM